MQHIVNIDVDDLGEAIAFYTTALGLSLGRRFGADAAELLGSSTPIYLLVKAAGTPCAAGSTQLRSYARHWTPAHLDFVVDDIDAAVARACAAGARLEAPVSEHRWGRLGLMGDPFGHGFCFVQFAGRGYDEIAD